MVTETKLPEIPQHLVRHPERHAIDALAERFGLPNTPEMQDWEWEVADPGRIEEFFAAYNHGALSDDERFVLMEMLLESFEESPRDLEVDAGWSELLTVLEENVELHLSTIWDWSAVAAETREERFRVTPALRAILRRHYRRYLADDETGSA